MGANQLYEESLEIFTEIGNHLALNHPASSRDNQDQAARLLVELEPQLWSNLAADPVF